MADLSACSCGASIRLVPTPTGALMPIDVDRDPDGALIAVKHGGRWCVRVLTAAERAAPPPGVRYRPHWSTCPRADQYRRHARLHAPTTWPDRLTTGTPDHTGPCGRCRVRFPHRYGPGARSTLCPACLDSRNG